VSSSSVVALVVMLDTTTRPTTTRFPGLKFPTKPLSKKMVWQSRYADVLRDSSADLGIVCLWGIECLQRSVLHVLVVNHQI